jgi:hypothetical protein
MILSNSVEPAFLYHEDGYLTQANVWARLSLLKRNHPAFMDLSRLGLELIPSAN